MSRSKLPAARRRSVARLSSLAAIGASAALALVAGCASPGKPLSDAYPPIVFVHGNGDSGAVWLTTVWRFESNGWPRDRLYAGNVPYPSARNANSKPQAGRTSATENRDYLAGEVDRVLARTGASKVVLVGNSRGGYAIRDFIRNAGGAAKVSAAILGGTPNHGVYARTDFAPDSEFNGAGPYLTALNAPQGPAREEVTAGVRWMTVRSDANDKYAQPTGKWIGQPKLATNVSFEGPALAGAYNVVLPGLDHRELSFHARAFEQDWKFLLGSEPARLDVVPEERVTLNGIVTRLEGATPTNVPLVGARLDVFTVSCASGERLGSASRSRTIGADGKWGPFATRPDACLEFVVSADGYAVTHVYRSPFPRSSDLVNLRPARLKDTERTAGSVVVMYRPRGYLGLGRDTMSLDGRTPPGIPPGVPGVDASRLMLPDGPQRTVVAEFNGERIAARTWPAKQNQIVFAELHY